MAREDDDRVVAYLREARRDELALARTLRAQVAASPRGSYRAGLQRYLEETRGHARRLERRLDELGAADSPLRTGVRALREAVTGVLAWGRLPLRSMGSEQRLLQGAQYGCATEGLVIATYTALEVVATRASDPETARLASEIRAEEQQMLEWLRHEILKLTDPFLREELEAPDSERGEPAERQRPGRARTPEVSVADVRRALSRAERQRADRT